MFFSNILQFVKGVTPLYTDLISDSADIDSIVFDGVNATITTATDHNLEVSNYVIVKNVSYVYPLSSITYSATTGILTGVLGSNHQIFKSDRVVSLTGDFIGSAVVLSLSDDDIIQLQLPTGLTISSLNVNKILKKFINSYFRVDEVVNVTSYKILYTFNSGDITSGGDSIYNSRVDAGYDIDLFLKNHFTKSSSKTKPRLFIEYDSNEVSRSDFSQSDFNTDAERNSANYITNADIINIYFIANTTDDYTHCIFIDQARSEIRNALLRTLQNNQEVDVGSNHNMMYNGGEPVKSDLQNLSIFKYNFYIQNIISSDLEYDDYAVERVTSINVNAEYNVTKTKKKKSKNKEIL